MLGLLITYAVLAVLTALVCLGLIVTGADFYNEVYIPWRQFRRYQKARGR